MKKTKMFGRIGMTLVFAVITFICLFPFYVLPVMGSYTTEELMKTLPFWFGSSFFKNTQTLLQSNFLRLCQQRVRYDFLHRGKRVQQRFDLLRHHQIPLQGA